MARLRRPAPPVGGVPAEVGDQLDPLWRDVHALEAHPVWGVYVDAGIRSRLAMGARVNRTLVARWALDHGFESTTYPRTVDWHALRAAGGE